MWATEHFMTISGAEDRDFFLRLGERIKALRKARGLTQIHLAERLGYSQQQIVAFEKGRRRMYASVLPRLAEALGVPVEELLGIQSRSTKRGPSSRLERQLERLAELPRSQQRVVSNMLDGLLQQAGQ